MWHRMGQINHQVKAHRKVLDEILDGQMQMVAVIQSQSELATTLAEFATDMAGLLVDLMQDVADLADHSGHPEIRERIDARADIAGAMLKLRNESL